MMTVSTSELFLKREISSRDYAKMVRSVKVSDTQILAERWVKFGKPSILVLSPKPKTKEWAKIRKFASQFTGSDVELEAFS
jgi:hypothetical protein